MNKTFAVTAALLALLLPLGAVSAQELGIQTTTAARIHSLHVVAVGMEVDGDLIPVSRDRIVVGTVVANGQEHRVGIFVRDTGEEVLRYKLRGVEMTEDGAVTGDIYVDNTMVGSFEFRAIHRGDATFWKGPVTIDGTTTTFIGKSIPRLHTATERTRVIADLRATGEQGTDVELEVRHHVRAAVDDERSRDFLRVRCREDGLRDLCKAELERLDDPQLAARLEILSDSDLERLRIRDDLVVRARTYMDAYHRTRIDVLRVEQQEAFELEAVADVDSGIAVGV
ncbi:MAG: hypothetical protein HY369_04335 [Candidatus Aenigmarchaeota archaeon]|nr:hypothetical protein [Candidatus Aenigmarchaeota archaeon]